MMVQIAIYNTPGMKYHAYISLLLTHACLVSSACTLGYNINAVYIVYSSYSSDIIYIYIYIASSDSNDSSDDMYAYRL